MRNAINLGRRHTIFVRSYYFCYPTKIYDRLTFDLVDEESGDVHNFANVYRYIS